MENVVAVVNYGSSVMAYVSAENLGRFNFKGWAQNAPNCWRFESKEEALKWLATRGAVSYA